MINDVLPGVPVPEAGELGPGGPRFTYAARMMGELLASFRSLPAASLRLDDLWADPQRLAAAAARWAEQLPVSAGRVLDAVPGLFAGRPVVLTHGDFAPVNILTDGTTLTGLLDFEAVRLADPLFDPARWAWGFELPAPFASTSSRVPSRSATRSVPCWSGAAHDTICHPLAARCSRKALITASSVSITPPLSLVTDACAAQAEVIVAT